MAEYGNVPGAGPLRPEGQALAALPKTEKDLPSTPSRAAKRQGPGVERCRDLWGGNESVKGAGTRYLPQAPGEDLEAYNERLQRSVFFNAYRRTVEGLTGLVFSEDPILGKDVPAPFLEQWENIDNAGTHGDVFLRDRMIDALIDGHTCILVEFPATGGTQSAADEWVIRPYWVPILKQNILSWRTAVENGRTVLTQVVLRECHYVPDGEFGEVEQIRYRVLYREMGIVGYRLLEVTSDNRVQVVDAGIYGNQNEIPLAEITTSGRRGILDSDPPLLDLAYLNVAHYQQASDEAFSRYKTCVGFLHLAGHEVERDDQGNPKGALTIGANTALVSRDPSAKAEYVSHSGNALSDCQNALENLKSEMGALGLAMLAPQKRSAETAEAKRLDKATSDSSLSVTARGLQDGVERAMYFHAQYLRQPSGGSITINRNYDDLLMGADVMTAYATLVNAGFPERAVLKALKEGGRIPEDEDVEVLLAEWMADREMKAAQAAEIAAVQRNDPTMNAA